MKESDMHPYQWEGVYNIMTNRRYALFLDMGLGKTVTTLTAIKKLMDEELAVSKVLVVAPKRVVESVWAQEVEKWDHLKGLRVSRVTGTVKQRLAALAVKADIYLLSRDNMVWICGLEGGLQLSFDMLVIDESSSFKNHDSKRFKALIKILTFKWILELTGTPAPNGLIDVWAQIYILDRGERLFTGITRFRESFFRYDSYTYKYSLIEGAEEKIHGRIKDICLSMKAEDYLQLPDKIINEVRIEMPPALKKEYRDFEREKVLELVESDKPITAVNAAALSNKLLQFANGCVYDNEEERQAHDVHSLKLEALAEILEQAQGRPVLVAYTFRSDCDRIMKHFKSYGPRKLEGDKEVVDWNEGKIQLMLMHPASGGHGLNLQAGGSDIVWYGQTWNLEWLLQFNTRIYRQGQTKTVIINKIILVGTMDEEVILAQETKEDGQNRLMEAVKSLKRKVMKEMQKGLK